MPHFSEETPYAFAIKPVFYHESCGFFFITAPIYVIFPMIFVILQRFGNY